MEWKELKCSPDVEDFTVSNECGKFTIHASTMSKIVPSCSDICRAIIRASGDIATINGIADYLQRNKYDYPLVELSYMAEMIQEKREDCRDE